MHYIMLLNELVFTILYHYLGTCSCPVLKVERGTKLTLYLAVIFQVCARWIEATKAGREQLVQVINDEGEPKHSQWVRQGRGGLQEMKVGGSTELRNWF